jgi:hypothetical protein
MSKFEKRFFTVLREQTAEERAAMEASLDDDTNPEEFDTEVPSPKADSLVQKASQIKTQQALEMKQQLEEWINRCTEFVEFLNGTNPGSIQYTLDQAEADTIFDSMKQSEARKISRVATELASLSESFKGYVAQSTNSQYKYV